MAKANRRCFFFDKNGNPISGGCPRPASACGFYHPEEDGWDTAKVSIFRSKRRQNSRRSPTPPTHGYRRDSRYRRSPSQSRSRSPARTRHGSIASSIPESPRNSRTSQTAFDPRRMSLSDMRPHNVNKGPQHLQPSTSFATLRSTSPKTQEQQLQASSSSFSFNRTISLPTPTMTSLQAGGSGDVPLPFPDRRPNMITTSTTIPKVSLPNSPSHSVPPHRPSISIRTQPSAPPAPPKDPLPMPPPQPLPVVPPALSAELVPPATVEPTIEEKRAMWEERTRILSESELAREQLATLEEQHVFALQIIESRYFANLPEEDKTRLQSQLAEIEKQRDEAKRTHEESVEKLFNTGSWPIAPPSSIEVGMEEKHIEVVKYIQELKDTALGMSKILGDISMFKSPPLFLSDNDDAEGDGAAMDIDQPDGGTARRKRRRISENGGSAPSMPTQEELDEFLERLAHMEGLISTLENDINEHGREAREEFELLVDTKLDEFQAAREEEERQRIEEEQQQMQDLEQDITLTGEQVGELATEIGDLIMRVSKLEVDVQASRKGRQETFEKVLEVERHLQEYISIREADVHAIQTFEKALNAYTSRPPSPPATPSNAVSSFDYVFESLEEPMVQALRSRLVPVIEHLRKDVEDMVRTQNAELYSTLWNKITVTLKVLEMIQSKISQGDIDPT